MNRNLPYQFSEQTQLLKVNLNKHCKPWVLQSSAEKRLLMSISQQLESHGPALHPTYHTRNSTAEAAVKRGTNGLDPTVFEREEKADGEVAAPEHQAGALGLCLRQSRSMPSGLAACFS